MTEAAEAFSDEGLARLQRVLAGHVEPGGDESGGHPVPGLAWLVSRHGEVHAGALGTTEADGAGAPVRRDTIFRVSSMTKPVAAVAALILVEDCRLRLDEPVDRWLPELADRRVLADPHGLLDATVPADRPISVRDLLTFRPGIGADFTATGPQPVMEALGRHELGFGPPQPARPPALDEWLRRLGTLPLSHQPGERWLYDTPADVLGALVARASGQPFDAFLRERVFEPLGMADTGFHVPADKLDRFGPVHFPDGSVCDPTDGQWSTPPAFPSGGAGLVSTVDDWAAFASMLLGGGTHRVVRVLSRPTVEVMTTNQLTPEQLTVSGPDPSGAAGWGFGVAVTLRATGPARPVGSYGWDGGMGSSWGNAPSEGSFGVLLTNQTWSSPNPPAVTEDFWTAAATAVAD